MEPETCKVCGMKMLPNPHGAVGDPVWVCPTDDTPHRAAAAARKLEAEQLLRDAAKPKSGPTPDDLAAIGACARPDPAKVTP